MPTAHNHLAPIRDAIACGEFHKAQELWSEYMAFLRGELRRGALTPAQMDEARELLDWARVSVLCSRAHLQNRLRSFEVAGAYGASPSQGPKLGRFRAEG